jgi:hypothetical protein
MGKERNPEELVDSNGLDNWYGTAKTVGIRDMLVGVAMIVMIVLSIVIFSGINTLKEQAAQNSMVTCPKCNHTFKK